MPSPETDQPTDGDQYPQEWNENFSVEVYEYLEGDAAAQKAYGISQWTCWSGESRRSTADNEPIGMWEFFFPAYSQIKEHGCDCLNLFIEAFDPIEKYCQVDQRNGTYVLSFLAKNYAHEWLSSFGYHMYAFGPDKMYAITPKEFIKNYDTSPAPEIYWWKRISKMVADYNKKHPNYDFPDSTYMWLQNLVEAEMEKEIKSETSPELANLWKIFQWKIKIFVEML